MGTIIPFMGSIATPLSDALFFGVQQRLLALFFGQPDRSFYTNELLRLTGTGRGALQRELERLASSGLITMHSIGNQKHYQANRAAPIFAEVRGIVLKTFGLVDVLRAALTDLGERIKVAFVFGSVARGTDTAASDIDVLVVADDVAYGELFEHLSAAEAALGRKVNPTLYSPAELARKQREDNHFVTRVLAQPKLFLKGGEDELVSA
jgi:predicted nucleotidyltransferase